MASDRVILEICVDSVESAIAADRGGADRIELCSSLSEGGLTPSAGLISTVRSRVSLGLFVMIRPRAGDFCYSADEFEVMKADIARAIDLGADGVVFGILKPDGAVDIERSKELVEFARPLGVTFHRAFDMSRDLEQSLEEVVQAGADRVLTSGGEQNVELGKKAIAQLCARAGDRIVVMAGSGVNEKNVRQLVMETGVREIHASLRSQIASAMEYRNARISFSEIAGRDYQRYAVVEERVRRMVALVSDVSGA